jgi:uncharacterized membrane protein YbhN (UPF0104 family)
VRAGVFSSFLSGLAVLTSPQRLLRTLAWFVLNWGIGVSMYFLPLRVFFPEARFSWALFALGVAGLGVAAPSSPGSIGVLEGSIVAALAVFNLDSSTALAFAFMLHMVQYALTCLLGAYGLAREGETLTGLYRQLLKQKPVEINSNTDHHAKE